jgi:hypothetical protein
MQTPILPPPTMPFKDQSKFGIKTWFIVLNLAVIMVQKFAS